jgi:hypothetical protein
VTAAGLDDVKPVSLGLFIFEPGRAELSGNGATIHRQVDAGDEAALVGSKEQCRRGEFIRGSKSSHWDHLLEVIAGTLVSFRYSRSAWVNVLAPRLEAASTIN